MFGLLVGWLVLQQGKITDKLSLLYFLNKRFLFLNLMYQSKNKIIQGISKVYYWNALKIKEKCIVCRQKQMQAILTESGYFIWHICNRNALKIMKNCIVSRQELDRIFLTK